MTRKSIYLLFLAALCFEPALSHEGNSELVEELIVYGRSQQMLGAADAASEGVVGYDDIKLPPILRVGELVEAIPGMVATQHSGTGKANQYFLRGFNLDHGTDFSAFVDGIPVNMRTHGHGQGYLDLNFIIPELVETTYYRKGPYSPEVGDFSSAGSVEFKYYDALEESIVSVTAGGFDYYRGLAAGTASIGEGALTAAYDYTRYSGPWEIDEDLSQTRVHLSYARDFGATLGSISLSGYSGRWNSTDQIPRREVEAGNIDILGFIDPDLGGKTDRYALNAMLDFGDWVARVYAVDYDFGLYSNFTYLLDDPVDGDQFEQTDKRRIYGFRVDGERDFQGFSIPTSFHWGGDIRVDDISEVGLFSTVERARNGTVRQDEVRQSSASAYGDLRLQVSKAFRASFGVRADYFDWDVQARRDENSGEGDDFLLSPKLNLAYRVGESAELYANWGRGFHSNDVRGAVISVDPVTGDPADPVDVLARSEGAEIGIRYEHGQQFNASLVVFQLDLDSELLFVGDAGTTEALGASERTGIEFSSFWQANEWLAMNVAYTYTDSKFALDEGAGREIPGAIPKSGTLGLNAAWDSGWFASARLRYLGSAPLIEDDSVRSDSSTLVNAGFGYRLSNIELRLDVFNLFDSTDDDISYYYASRLEGEPLDGVEDVHFHPLEPRSARASVTFYWN